MDHDKGKIDGIFRKRMRLDRKYSLDNPGNRFNFEHLYARVDNLLHAAFGDLSAIRLLDLGSGMLFWPDQMIKIGIARDRCTGMDLLHWRLAEGKKKGRLVPAVAASAAQLPFSTGSIDLVSQFTMMTSVMDRAMRRAIVNEILRVLRPAGYILWYDFRYNNPFNPNTRAIGKAELARLFDGLPIRLEKITVLPQLARKMGIYYKGGLKFADRFSILRTHYLALIGPKG